VAKLVQSELTQSGYKVILTRDRDVFLSLDDRVNVAIKANTGLFVSIHFNSVDDKSVSGAEVFALTPTGQCSTYNTKKNAADSKCYPGNTFDYWNTIPSYSMLYSLKQRLKLKDRGVKHARFKVLKDLSCPGILMEIDFLSNDTVAKQFTSPDYLQKTASAIANGVLRYHVNLNAIRKAK
jgi:N-acetylmuramoyl-L-alanine amidase